ncbi:MAG: hypothetical protein KDE49_13115 [Novosphingobium sp.]|nr:hypothetical protein [Novosphingobium sp.]
MDKRIIWHDVPVDALNVLYLFSQVNRQSSRSVARLREFVLDFPGRPG